MQIYIAVETETIEADPYSQQGQDYRARDERRARYDRSMDSYDSPRMRDRPQNREWTPYNR